MTTGGGVPGRSLLLYAQDARGLGHITRTLTIARHVLAAYPDTVAYIATKSHFAPNVALPERCDYVKLPSRRTATALPEDADEAGRAHFRRLRSQILRDLALGLAPDLVLVDHEPLGAMGEFRDGLWALKAACRHTRFVFGLRDIMDDVERIRAQWRELGVYEALEQVYDGIAVYGSRALYDVARAYDIPACVAPKLQYCGYVVRDQPVADPCDVRREYGVPEDAPFLLATVGSGSDGFPVLEATQRAVGSLQQRYPNLHVVMVTGPFMPADQQAVLQGQATRACQVVTTADNFRLMAAADASVSMGGYNSVCEALVVGCPLVIVPRATHKVEQRIRAEVLAERGLARWVHPKELDAGRLGDALDWALSQDRVGHVQRVREVIPEFDGAVRLTSYLARWLGAD